MAAPDPLEPDIVSLLDGAKAIPEMDAERKAAIFARVAVRLPPPSSGSDGGGPTGGALPRGAGAAALAVTFALGVGTGVLLDRHLTAASSPPHTHVESAPPTPRPSSPAASVAVVAPPALRVEDLPAAKHRARPAGATFTPATSTPPSARGLSAERALLDAARSALARGEAAEALLAAERHGQEYPHGALVEEREAIVIKALVALGRREEARARLRDLERSSPASLVLRAARAAVDGPP